MDVCFLSYGASRREYQARPRSDAMDFTRWRFACTPLFEKQVPDQAKELDSSEEDMIKACVSAPVRAPECVALCEADRPVYEVKRRGKNAILQRNVQPGQVLRRPNS
jgi:hypothetical protein